MEFNKKFRKGIILAIAVVLAIALFDIMASKSNIFGSVDDYTLGNYSPGWWDLFYKFNIILLLVIPITYYFFARKDLSESISLFMTSYILWFFGVADILYFILQGKMMPEIYPWLNGHPVMGTIASILGSDQITRTALLISVFIGFILIYFLNKEMEKIN